MNSIHSVIYYVQGNLLCALNLTIENQNYHLKSLIIYEEYIDDGIGQRFGLCKAMACTAAENFHTFNDKTVRKTNIPDVLGANPHVYIAIAIYELVSSNNNSFFSEHNLLVLFKICSSHHRNQSKHLNQTIISK